MARKKKKNGFKRKLMAMTIPITVVAGIAPGVVKVYEARGGGVSGMAREAGRIYTGVDFWNGQFNIGFARYGLLPIIAGIIAHKIANKLGINRALASAGIPLIRV